MKYVRNIIIALLVCGVVPVWADTPNNRPTAILKVSCPSSSESCDDFTTGKVTGPAPLTVHFDGGDSSDSDGEVQLYHFDYSSSSLHEAEGFDEGSIDNRSHTYDNPGSYLAYLMVKDNDGKWSKIAYRHIHVTPFPNNPQNNPPTAILKGTCVQSQDGCDDNMPGLIHGLAPLTVEFDGSNSHDLDGSVEYYHFDLSTGIYHGSESAGFNTYFEGGNYVASLVVTDNEGAASATSNEIIISVTKPNNPPTAILKASCPILLDVDEPLECDDTVPGYVTGPAPLTVKFDASDSADSDGTVMAYELVFSGSGNPKLPQVLPGHGVGIDVTYDSYSAFSVVTDNEGAKSTLSSEVIITVTEPNHPPAVVLTASCAKPQDDCDDSVPGNVTGSAPLTVLIDGSGSNDTDGSIAHYHFFKQQGWSSPSTVQPKKSFTYHTPGSYTATLMVTDDKGAGSAQSIDITVTRSGSESDQQSQTDAAISKTKRESDKPKTTGAPDNERKRKERNRAFEEDSTVAELKREADRGEARNADDTERNRKERNRAFEEDSTVAELKREVDRAEARQAAGDQNKTKEKGQTSEEDAAESEEGDRYDKKIEKPETEPCEGTKMDCHEA